jgi:hypothetical protein
VYQFSTTAFTAGGTGTRQQVGSGDSTTRVQWGGAFDDAYYASAGPTGSLYVCGGGLADLRDHTLYRVPISNNAMGAPTIGPAIAANSAGDCSPITEVKNGDNEYLDVGQPDAGTDGTATVCSGACLYMFNVGDVRETWTVTFAGNQATTGQNVTVNGVVLTTAANGTGNNWDIGGSQASDVANLAAEVNANVPGYSATHDGVAVVTITRTAFGNVAANTVTDTLNQATTANTADGRVAADWGTTEVPRAGLASPGGTSAVIVDNISGTPGHSQVYYMQLNTPGNAIQASQAGLQ